MGEKIPPEMVKDATGNQEVISQVDAACCLPEVDTTWF